MKRIKFYFKVLGLLLVVGGLLALVACGGGKKGGGGYGTIFIESFPSGAKIYLDGNDTGKTTPNNLTNVSEGQHTVKLTKEGYEDWTKTVTVSANQPVTISANDAILNPKIGGDDDLPPPPVKR